MKNSIEQLTKNEMDNVSGGGMREITNNVLLTCFEIIKGASFPVIGGLAGLGIIKALSKPHGG